MTIAEGHNRVRLWTNQTRRALVDVLEEAVTAGAVGRRRGDSGPACADVIPPMRSAHPARVQGVDGTAPPTDTRLHPTTARDVIAVQHMRGLCPKLEILVSVLRARAWSLEG